VRKEKGGEHGEKLRTQKQLDSAATETEEGGGRQTERTKRRVDVGESVELRGG